MPHVTDYGYIPTHLWPSRDDVDTHYGAFRLKEGESIPHPGSTKHLWNGPGVYVFEAQGLACKSWEFHDVPTDSFGDELGWLSTPRLSEVFNLGPYEDGRTFVDLVTWVEARPNVDEEDGDDA